MTPTVFVAALVIAVGLAGIVVPVLPGSILVLLGILGWSIQTGTTTGWIVFGLSATLLAAGTVIKYVLPGRRLRTAGVPSSTLWVGGLVGIIGFFVVPVVGLVLGFVVGVYLAELRRIGSASAWASTVGALKAVGLSMLVELAAALLATAVWVAALVLA